MTKLINYVIIILQKLRSEKGTMKVSSKGEYGLRALFDLAQRYYQEPISSAEIAARQGLPESYLNQLLLTLRRGGLVQSLRGPQGGYRLSRPPESITLAEALALLEGDISVREASLESDSPEGQILRQVWDEVDEAIRQILENITLDDLCRRKQAHERKLMYYI
ncbi:MAG: RrF2 family transcriptional regulator [Anaerolineae bacterium]